MTTPPAQSILELAREMEDRGFDRKIIAARLGKSRRQVGDLLGPKQKEKPPVNDKTEPVGDLPTWIQPTVNDYERDQTPAPPPDARWFNNRQTSAEEQGVIVEALRQARAREASVVAMGR